MIAVTIYITRKAAKILHKEGTKAMATACRQRAQSLHIAVILGLRLARKRNCRACGLYAVLRLRSRKKRWMMQYYRRIYLPLQ